MEYRTAPDGSVPVVYCQRVGKWLPIEEHTKCEHCVGIVYDEADTPVSFLCAHHEKRQVFQPEYEPPPFDDGRGPPVLPQMEEDAAEDEKARE